MLFQDVRKNLIVSTIAHLDRSTSIIEQNESRVHFSTSSLFDNQEPKNAPPNVGARKNLPEFQLYSAAPLCDTLTSSKSQGNQAQKSHGK